MKSLASFLVLFTSFRTLDAECISSTPSHVITNFKTIYEANENISYSCQIGYILIGSRRAVCLENGDWSHPHPRCGKFRFIQILVVLPK